MNLTIVAGTADVTVPMRARNIDGTPVTSFEHNTAGIDLWYWRQGSAKASITEAALAALTSAHADGGVEFIDDGVFRLDLPDAACAAGVPFVVVGGSATSVIIDPLIIELATHDASSFITATQSGLATSATATAIKAKTDNLPADPASAAVIAAAFSSVPQSVWARALATGYTADQLVRIIAAVLAGKATVSDGTYTFRDVGDTKDMVVATASNGERSSVAYGS